MKFPLGLVLVGLLAALAGPASAAPLAEPGPPPPGDGQRQGTLMSLEVRSVDAGSRTVTAVAHCVPPEQAGKVVQLPVDPAVELGAFVPGTSVGVEVMFVSNRQVIVSLRPDFECRGDSRPGNGNGTPPPGNGPGDTRPGDKDGGKGGRKEGPQAPKGIFKKDMKLDVDLESFEDGAFSASLNKVLKGVPTRMAAYLSEELKGETFEVNLTAGTKCFVKEAKVACSVLATRVDDSADGIRATVLVRALKADDAAGDEEEDEPDMVFRGKKIVTG